ncbi:hypothetical protein C4572_01965 [Candidatus Parcubacteria bacterium]|nr:MAG: hypothetical protein C4572_01965 [Candidatus Parcubacteria bacterium]
MIGAVKSKIYYLWGLKFIKDVFTLQVGSFFGTGLTFVASVIYARIFGAEMYGKYALIFALTGLVGIFMDWGVGYTTLTLLSEAYEKNDKAEIKSLIVYFIKVNAIISVTLGLLAIIIGPLLAGILYNQPEIGELARLIFLAVIFRTFFSLLVVLLQIMRKIKYLTVLENIDKLVLNGLCALLVLLGAGLWGIAWGQFITSIILMVFSLWIYFNFYKRNSLLPSFMDIYRSFNQIKFLKYFKFGFTVSLDKNISNLFSILPIVFLGALGTPEQVAMIKIALGFLALPKMFLSSISRMLQVQLPKAKVFGLHDLKSNFYKSSLYTGFAFAALTLVSLIFAPVFIKIFYGQQFTSSIKFIYPLSLGIIFSGFMVGYGSLYRTLNKMKTVIMVNVVNIISGLIIYRLVLLLISPLSGTVILIVYFSLFSFFVNGIFLRRHLNKV